MVSRNTAALAATLYAIPINKPTAGSGRMFFLICRDSVPVQAAGIQPCGIPWLDILSGLPVALTPSEKAAAAGSSPDKHEGSPDSNHSDVTSLPFGCAADRHVLMSALVSALYAAAL
jgi:hypothetical protein